MHVTVMTYHRCPTAKAQDRHRRRPAAVTFMTYPHCPAARARDRHRRRPANCRPHDLRLLLAKPGQRPCRGLQVPDGLFLSRRCVLTSNRSHPRFIPKASSVPKWRYCREKTEYNFFLNKEISNADFGSSDAGASIRTKIRRMGSRRPAQARINPADTVFDRAECPGNHEQGGHGS